MRCATFSLPPSHLPFLSFSLFRVINLEFNLIDRSFLSKHFQTFYIKYVGNENEIEFSE